MTEKKTGCIVHTTLRNNSEALRCSKPYFVARDWHDTFGNEKWNMAPKMLTIFERLTPLELGQLL